MKKLRLAMGLLLLLPAFGEGLSAQNINGERILVGRESITIINFPDKVLNINFSDDAAYDYYIPKRREEKSISLQFNKDKPTGPNTSLLVNEGGRSHMFRIRFDSTYNINDDSRPPLWYDHSNLKELKTFVQKQKELMSGGDDEENMAKLDKKQEEERKKEMDARRAEARQAQQKQEEDLALKEKQIEERRKQEEVRQKEEAAALAKAKKEAEDTEKQLLLAKQKEAAERKAADEQASRQAAELAKKQAAEDQRLKELKAKSDAEAIAKAEREAEEKKKLGEQELARQKALNEEKRKATEAAFAKKEAEKKEAQEKLARLEAARKERDAEKAYSEMGLWQRYGKKGIDVYNIPAGQMEMVNADFFIVSDTLRNFRIADSLINTNTTGLMNIAAGNTVNGGVRMSLEAIAFKDVHTFYKIKIDNGSNEDFLLGKTYMYWYDAREKAKMIIKCSYLTHISFYPIVRPGTSRYIVFTTRAANVIDNESLVLFIEDRRKEKGGTNIVIPAKDYLVELAKVQTSVKTVPVGGRAAAEEPPANNKQDKKSRKKRN